MSLRTSSNWACKVSSCSRVWIFFNNLGKFWLHEIAYREILREKRNGQVFWVELLTRILGKLSLYFSEVSTIFYEFCKFELISKIFKRIINLNSVGPNPAHSPWESAACCTHETKGCGGLLRST
jgi:hypothetical protein